MCTRGFNPVKFAVIQSGAKSSGMIISVSPQGVAYTGVMKNEVISPTVPHRWGHWLQMTGTLQSINIIMTSRLGVK